MNLIIYKNECIFDFSFVENYYNLPHRYYHNKKHITDGLFLSEILGRDAKVSAFNLSCNQKLAWIFHDIVYAPGAKDNESESIKLMNHLLKQYKIEVFSKEDLEEVSEIILSTVNHTPRIPSANPIIDLDLSGFIDPYTMSQGTIAISKEFNINKEDFIQGRINFLNELLEREIYQTDFAKMFWEDLAKENIQQFVDVKSEIHKYVVNNLVFNS